MLVSPGAIPGSASKEPMMCEHEWYGFGAVGYVMLGVALGMMFCILTEKWGTAFIVNETIKRMKAEEITGSELERIMKDE